MEQTKKGNSKNSLKSYNEAGRNSKDYFTKKGFFILFFPICKIVIEVFKEIVLNSLYSVEDNSAKI